MKPFRVLGLIVVLGAFLVLIFPPNSGSVEVVFSKGCLSCHGPEPKYPVRGIRAQYMTSGHKNIGNASYANGGGCQKCHTNEGFIE